MKSASEKHDDGFQKMLEAYNLGNPFGRIFFVIGIAATVFLSYLTFISFVSLDSELVDDLKASALEEKDFNGFKTDISNVSVPLEKIYKEGPARGFIPAVMKPKFAAVDEANIQDAEVGILVKLDDKNQRFYPLRILNWHEIVNDKFGDYSFVVTYSPITGTSAVFDRKLSDGNIAVFDVTGMLYESNLIMFDISSESLWSQNERRSIAGKYNNERLHLAESSLVSFSYLKSEYPNAKVMTDETGFVRNYNYNPYKDYLASDNVYPDFGISRVDTKYPSKDILFSVPFNDKVYSVFVKDLEETPSAKFDEDGFTLTIKKSGDEIIAQVMTKGATSPFDSRDSFIPGYYEMWFSWAVKHEIDGILFGSF